MFSRVIILWFFLATSWEVSAFKECSRNKYNPNSFGKRIVNGEEARKCEFPWMVSVNINLNGTDNYHCGGSIIDDRTVLTAAHCVDKYIKAAGTLNIIAGDHNRTRWEGTEQRVRIDKIFLHPQYNRYLWNDLGILKLSAPLNLSSECVSPICLPANKQLFPGPCVAMGWGNLETNGIVSEVLQKATLPVISDEKCMEDANLCLQESQLCAGGNGKGSCNHDSGGPLVCKGPDGKSYLAGVTSSHLATGCAIVGEYGFYAEVSYNIDWITGFME